MTQKPPTLSDTAIIIIIFDKNGRFELNDEQSLNTPAKHAQPRERHQRGWLAHPHETFSEYKRAANSSFGFPRAILFVHDLQLLRPLRSDAEL